FSRQTARYFAVPSGSQFCLEDQLAIGVPSVCGGVGAWSGVGRQPACQGSGPRLSRAAAATASQMLSSYSVTCCGIEAAAALESRGPEAIRAKIATSLIGMNVGVVVDGRWQRGPVEV